jgi:hypothetical protein
VCVLCTYATQEAKKGQNVTNCLGASFCLRQSKTEKTDALVWRVNTFLKLQHKFFHGVFKIFALKN